MVPENVLLRRVIELLIGKSGMANIRISLCNNEQNKCDSSDQVPRQPDWLTEYFENLFWLHSWKSAMISIAKYRCRGGSNLRDWKASWINKKNTSGYEETARNYQYSQIGLSTNISLAILGVEKLISQHTSIRIRLLSSLLPARKIGRGREEGNYIALSSPSCLLVW